MKKVILFSLITLLFACGSNTNNNSNESTQTKEDIIRMEKKFPHDYIEIYGSFTVKLNNKVKFNLELTNKANTVTYYEIEIEISFYNSNDTKLGSEIVYFNYELHPKERYTQTFKSLNKYKGISDFKAKIISAKSFY